MCGKNYEPKAMNPKIIWRYDGLVIYGRMILSSFRLKYLNMADFNAFVNKK
ncbi:hypothetical protein AO372_0273 [Moraxella catarrhalis]|nr:hypothetical protein AO372_0273 [Moraxella catarrhalis]